MSVLVFVELSNTQNSETATERKENITKSGSWDLPSEQGHW